MFCSALYFFMPNLVKLMAQNEDLLLETTSYVQIEIFGLLLESLNGFLLIPLEFLKMKKALLSCLVIKLFLTVIFDLVFLSELSFSLQLGVNGVAYCNIIAGLVNILVWEFFLFLEIKPTRDQLLGGCSFSWLKTWFRLGFFFWP